jgi:hypothetical protein
MIEPKNNRITVNSVFGYLKILIFTPIDQELKTESDLYKLLQKYKLVWAYGRLACFHDIKSHFLFDLQIFEFSRMRESE